MLSPICQGVMRAMKGKEDGADNGTSFAGNTSFAGLMNPCSKKRPYQGRHGYESASTSQSFCEDMDVAAQHEVEGSCSVDAAINYDAMHDVDTNGQLSRSSHSSQPNSTAMQLRHKKRRRKQASCRALDPNSIPPTPGLLDPPTTCAQCGATKFHFEPPFFCCRDGGVKLATNP